MSSGSKGLSRRDVLKYAVGAAVGIPVGIAAKTLWNPNGHSHVGVYTAADVTSHLRASRTRIMSAMEVMTQGNAECIDGRSDQRVVGIPGGDMGDIILKIAASERASNHEFSDREIEAIFDRYLERNPGGFYMHTDDHGLQHAAMDMPGGGISQAELEQMIADPGNNQEILLDVLTNAHSIGCGHIKRMVTHPQEYPGVRPGIIQNCLRKFFREKWAQNPRIDYAKLRGEHQERAVVRIRRQGGLRPESPVPLVQPNVQISNRHGTVSDSVFILHTDMAERKKDEFTENALEITQLPANVQHRIETITTLQETYTGSTARALAQGKPTFDATYQDNPEHFTVRQVQ